jgi:methyl-accepting chemotaxis protein
VRALAQKSAEAAKDIKTLITESVTRIDQGTKLASASGEVFKHVTESINEVTGKINQIAHASNEQTAGISQVHQAITSIDSVTQQNAALVEQTSAAAESMRDQATNLMEKMAFFKTTSARQSGRANALAAKTTSPSLAAPIKSEKPVKQAMAEAKPASKAMPAAQGDEWAEF